MKVKLQIVMISLAINTILVTMFFSFSNYLFSFFTYSLLIGCTLLILALPLSFLVDHIKVNNYLAKLLLRYIIYIIPGLILYIYLQELGILLLSSIVATTFFLVEYVFLKMSKNIKNIFFTSLTILFIFIFVTSMFFISG